MSRRRKFWNCNKCKTRFRRMYREIVCDACKEISLQKRQETYKNNNLWEQTKIRIKKRDGSKCKICGTSEKLIIHHWNRNRNDNDYGNLITLCHLCHSKLHSIYRQRFNIKIKWKSYYRRKM